MKPNEIQQLIGVIASSGLEEVNIEAENFKISVKRSATAATVVQNVTSAPMASAPVYTPAPVQQSSAPAATQESAPATPAAPAASATQVTIKSPMIGTFYRSSKPEVPVFVNVGDEVKKGQTLCIIEAMKLFNEIEADMSGRIVKILVENASPVEYEQPLFIIEPA